MADDKKNISGIGKQQETEWVDRKGDGTVFINHRYKNHPLNRFQRVILIVRIISNDPVSEAELQSRP